MGSFFSRNRNPTDELESIVQRLDQLTSRCSNLRQNRDGVIWWISAVLFFLSTSYSAIIYIDGMEKRYLHMTLTFFAAAFVFFTLRFISIRSFDFFVRRSERKMEELNDRRTQIIEDVKENEKFKVACEIIEKYGSPNDLAEMGVRKREEMKSVPKLRKSLSPQTNTANNSIMAPRPSIPHDATIAPNQTMINESNVMDNTVALPQGPAPLNMTFNTPMIRRQPVRPFVPASRTALDKIIDYIVGDGPSNRFALICKQCHVHNGMALREEFESMAFICFNCGLYNPARDATPLRTPGKRKLTNPVVSRPYIRTATNSESSENESDAEAKTIVSNAGGDRTPRDDTLTALKS